MKRFLSLLLLTVMVLSCAAVFSSCKKKGGDDDVLAARLFDESGLLCVRRNGKYGFINKKGIEVIPCEYSSADRFRNGTSVVVKEKGGASSFIGTDGEPLFERTFSSAYPFDAYDRAVVHTTEDGPAELINKAGETVFSAPEIESTGAGLYLYESADGKMGAVDPNGETVLAPTYESLETCYRIELNEFGYDRYVPINDRLYAESGDGAGNPVRTLIDRDGNVIYTGGQSLWSSYFYNGRTYVLKDDGFEVIDLDGNVIFSRTGRVEQITASYLVVDVLEGSRETVNKHGQCVLYDWNGEVVYDFRTSGYTPASFFGANDFVVRDPETDQYGLINLKGETVVPCTYDAVVPSDGNGNCVCRKGDACYVIDGEGKTVFQKTCDYLSTSDCFSGEYYLACYKTENGPETYELLSPKGKTVKSFGSEYRFGSFLTSSGETEWFVFDFYCVYYADGYLVARDAETGTFVIMQKKSKKKFKVISSEPYDYFGIPTYFN